jgi:MFS family permease
MIGRKYTFLLTLILMGGSTFAIGLVPGFKTIGWAAPIIVLILRLIQGLALGGEYGGAATYVAEHAPADRRGYWTSWIQTTATLGLFLALGIIIFIRNAQGVEKFSKEWGGWRYPFWISSILVIVSIVIRMRMSESPMFAQVKAEGKTSVNPLKESFGHRANFKMVLLALFGAVMGQGVIWYTGQFYAQSFLENTCKLEFTQSRNILLLAILFATPFFVFFGWLSDLIGRKWIMLLGMLLGVVFYRPIFGELLKDTNAKEWMKDKQNLADGGYNDNAKFDTIINKAGLYIVHHQTNNWIYKDTRFTEKRNDTLKMMGYTLYPPLSALGKDSFNLTKIPDTKVLYTDKVLSSALKWKFVWLVWCMVIFVTMVYGPMAAFLVEMFPTKIRYTSMSLPYHIGNGVFGGLVPFLGTLIVEFTKNKENPAGDPLAGLWYPIGVAALCLFIGTIYLRNKIDKDVMD